MFYVYVLYSSKYSKIYIGFTSDLSNRLKSHNELAKKGWTIRYRPWQLVYTEQYTLEKDARSNERRLKGAKGREWIWALINRRLMKGSYPPEADGSSILPFATKASKEAFFILNFNFHDYRKGSPVITKHMN